ncbi:MAG: hypothetical protein HOL85_18560 [Rhodospirillaceae bacterium]|nr:hypothetical protein [Rhodospirillaceae bacterium]MBT6136777.1 hypothetical protein [Rhodospirillaceae bacterium]
MSETDQSGGESKAAHVSTATDCTDLFVDGVMGAMVRDGVVRMNLVNTRYNVEGTDVEHAVVARMIMSRSGVRNLHSALESIMSKLTRSGDRGDRSDRKEG